MWLQNEKFFGRLCAVLTAANFALLMLYYVPYYIVETQNLTEGLVYFFTYAEEIFGWVINTAAAAVIFIYTLTRGIKSTVISISLLSLTRLIYALPYYYLIALDFGFDSLEGLCISLLVSALDVIVSGLHIFVLVFIGGFAAAAFKAKSLKRRELTAVKDTLADGLLPTAPFALSEPATVGVFALCFIEFTYKLALEIYNAVTYIIDYTENYRSAEIIYMVFRFIFVLLMLLLTHYISCKIKNLLIKERN